METQDPKDSLKSSQANPKNETEGKKFEDKVKDELRGTREGKADDDFIGFAKSNKVQILTFGALFLGILILIINPFFGGLILGAVAGYYFSDDIINFIRKLNTIGDSEDKLRYIVLGVILLAFFIIVPGIFIGAAMVAAIKNMMQGK